MQNTHAAGEDPSIGMHLKGVAVNQPYCCIMGNENIALVNVPNNTCILMDLFECYGTIPCSANKKPPTSLRECGLSMLWSVKTMYLFYAREFRHYNSHGTSATHEQSPRPSRKLCE
jgi:hypothetical protein